MVCGCVFCILILLCALVFAHWYLILWSDLQRSALLCLCISSAAQVMNDVGNQTSCRLAGLRPGTVYFVQVWRVCSNGLVAKCERNSTHPW